MATLLELTWTPVSLTRWVRPAVGAQAATVLDLTSPNFHSGRLLREVRTTVVARSWVQAASFFGGVGLEGGADLSVVRKLLASSLVLRSTYPLARLRNGDG